MSSDPIQAFLSTPSSLTPADVVNFYADKYGVDKDFAQRIAKQESINYNPAVVSGKRPSPKGAIGTMQLMPGTAQTLGVDPYDMHQNIEGGVRYLKQQLDQFNGDQRLAAAGYNAGPHRVQQYGGVPPFPETQDYVQKTAQDPTTEYLAKTDPVADFLAQNPEPVSQNVPRGTDSFDPRAFLPREKPATKLPDNFNVRKLLPKDRPVANPNQALIDSLNNPAQGQEVSTTTGQPIQSVAQQQQAAQDFITNQIQQHKAGEAHAAVEQQRLKMLSELPADQKLKTGQMIAAQRPLTDGEQQALGISPGYMERFAPGMAASLGHTLAGASQLVGYGLTGERENFASRGFEQAAQSFRERANLYGKQNLAGDLSEDVGSLVPDIAGSFLAPEGKIAQALYWGASGGLKAAGRGGGAEDIATNAVTNAALPAILHGTADLPLVQRVLGSGGLMSTITLAQGGDERAIAKSFILGGLMGIPGGERSPDDVIAQVADSPDIQRAVFDHYQNPTPENEAALRTALAAGGLKPEEIDTIANQAKPVSASSTAPKPTAGASAENTTTPESLKSTQGENQNATQARIEQQGRVGEYQGTPQRPAPPENVGEVRGEESEQNRRSDSLGQETQGQVNLFHTYDEAQKTIDAREDELERQGIDPMSLWDKESVRQLGGEQNLPPGASVMPPDLERLYAQRDALGATELQRSIDGISTELRKAGIADHDIPNVLEAISLHPDKTDALAQYSAAEHTLRRALGDPKRLAEDIYIKLASKRNLDVQFSRTSDDIIHPDKQTLADARNAVVGIRQYFEGGRKQELPTPEEAPPRYQPPSKVKEDLPLHQAIWRYGGIDPDSLTPQQVKAIRAAEASAGLYGKNAILKRSGKSFDDMQQAVGQGGTGHVNEYESFDDNSKDAFVDKIIQSIRGENPHYSLNRDPALYDEDLDKQYEQLTKDKEANPTIFDHEDAVAKAELNKPDSFLNRISGRVIRSGFDQEAVDAFRWAAGENYGFTPDTIDSILRHLSRISDDELNQAGVSPGDNGSTSQSLIRTNENQLGKAKTPFGAGVNEFFDREQQYSESLGRYKQGDRIEYVDADGNIRDVEYVGPEMDKTGGEVVRLKDSSGKPYTVDLDYFVDQIDTPMSQQVETARKQLEQSIRIAERKGTDYEDPQLAQELRRKLDDLDLRFPIQDPIAQFLHESESGATNTDAEAARVKAENDAELLRLGMQGGRGNIEASQGQPPTDTTTPDLFNPQENLFGPGTPSVNQPPDPVGSHMRQLTESLDALDPKATVQQRVSLASRLARQAALGKDAVTSAITTGRSTFAALGSGLKRVFGPPIKSSLKYAIGDWDGGLQKVAKDSVDFKKAIDKKVPDPLRQEAISNYMHADGDMATLQKWADASNPKYRPGYELAMKLTPEEQTIARNMRSYYDSMLQDGIDLGMFKAGLENFVNKIWKRPPVDIAKMTAEFGGGLKTDFASMKRAVWDSFFEGEQAGYDPVTKEIGKLAAIYNQGFGTAVAGRGLLKSINDLTASDGRPMVAFAGSGKVVTEPGDLVEGNQLSPDRSAIFIKPRTKVAIDLPGAGEHDPKIPINDYKVIDHPALRGWKYVTTGPDGSPVIMQEDMLIHPEGYQHLKNVLSNSSFRQIPVLKQLMAVQGAAKQLLFGFFSPFHTVQEGVHYSGHAIQSMISGQHLNPFSLPEVDMNNPNMDLMLRRGLKLYDFNAREALGEGLTGGPITDKIPIIGGKMHAFQDWQFQDFIPRLKAQTALDAFDRNMARYKNQMSVDQIAELTANQANASYGGLNYKYMGRNPMFQDFLRTTLIAPDFLEARGRFVGQALKGGGREQLIALGLLAASQFVAGRILSKQFSDDKDWHFDKPFSAVIGSREYKLRSVPGDILEAVTNTRPFLYNRLSPLMRTGVEAASGRDIQGQKVTPLQEAIDASSSFVPMQLRMRSNQTLWEKALDSAGLHSKVYKSPAQELISQYLRDKMGDGVPTEDQQKKSLERRTAITGLRGNSTEDLKKALTSGDFGKTETKQLIKRGTETKNQSDFSQLTDDQVLQVWGTMTPTEKAEVAPQLMEKANRYIGGDSKALAARKQLAPNQIQKYTPLYLEAMKSIPQTQKLALIPR